MYSGAFGKINNNTISNIFLKISLKYYLILLVVIAQIGLQLIWPNENIKKAILRLSTIKRIGKKNRFFYIISMQSVLSWKWF